MRVKEMHPLCCLPLENPAAGNHSPEPRTKLSRSCSAADANGLQWTSFGSESCSGCRSFAGVVHKWTNYGKGWRSRWFLLRNGVLSYSKNLQPETIVAGEDVRFIGDARFKHLCCSTTNSNRRHKHQKGVGIVHLKVSSFRESRSDERRFYVCTATKTLHLRANSKKERAAWIEALDSAKNASNITERLTNRLLKEGTSEVECEQIMLSEFSQVQGQLKSLSQDRLNLLHTITQLEGCKIEIEASESDFFDAQDHFPDLNSKSEGEMQRRKKLPEPAEKEQGVSLWSLIKDNIGKDLTRVCLPVYFNEPISSLQKCFEDLEYSYLLDRAYHHGNSLQRILNVAAFAVSGYASSAGRICKPFNPLLGETYEADYPEKGLRFLSEKVSHHPTLIACHCQGKGWKLWGDSNITSKFWGSSIQVEPVGVLTLEFDDGEIFQWSKVTTSIYNLIFGKIYCDHHGMMHIRGNGEYSCSLNFKQHSFLERKPRQVHGFVEDGCGRKQATVFGKWDESLYYIANVKPNLLWERTMPPVNLTRYNLTSFAITLNELTTGLQEKLPPTDSRLRPDQRHLENGEYDMANAEKLRLETRQRMSRKLQDNGWKPRWFQKDAENGTYRYLGGYWEKREERNWEGCPTIFG